MMISVDSWRSCGSCEGLQQEGEERSLTGGSAVSTQGQCKVLTIQNPLPSKPIYQESHDDICRFKTNPALRFDAIGTLVLIDIKSGFTHVFLLFKVRR